MFLECFARALSLHEALVPHGRKVDRTNVSGVFSGSGDPNRNVGSSDSACMEQKFISIPEFPSKTFVLATQLAFCRVVLQFCRVVLQFCRIVLQPCRVVLQPCRVVLQPCRVVLQFCRIALPKTERNMAATDLDYSEMAKTFPQSLVAPPSPPTHEGAAGPAS